MSSWPCSTRGCELPGGHPGDCSELPIPRFPPPPVEFREPLREAVNVDDLMQRDKLELPLRKIRADAVLDKNTIEHWNRMHPDEDAIDASWCDRIIAWCDGTGPMPTLDEVADA